MKIAALADVKAHLSAYVDEYENEGPVIITRDGKPLRYCWHLRMMTIWSG